MDFVSLLRIFFGISIIVVLYIIIVYSLRIMYKDVKETSSKDSKKLWALEILDPQGAEVLKKGSVVPINSNITIGRKSSNVIQLNNNFVSSEHANIFVRDDECILKDLSSTNGSYVNGDKVESEAILNVGDIVKIGEFIFKIII